MTLAFDIASEAIRIDISNPYTFNHTPIGTPKAVIVCAMHDDSSTDHITGITYGGVALTRKQTNADTAGEPGRCDIWFLGEGVPTGQRTVSISLASATNEDIYFVCVTLTSTESRTRVVDSDGISEDATDPSVTLQYGGKTAMAIAALYSGTALLTFDPNANCTTVLSELGIGSWSGHVIRQTTPGSSDFTIGGLAALDDVAYCAIAVAEQPDGEATLQGVATIAPTPMLVLGPDAVLQGVTTLSALALHFMNGAAILQGVATLDAAPTYTPKLDFTVHDLYIDDGMNIFACISHEDEQIRGNTRANPIRAEKQDVGQNPLEQRPEFGDYFAQGDFSHGSDQDYFHHVGRDERKYLASEGFNISEPGILRHLHTVAEAVDSSTIGRVTQAGGLLFVADGTTVRRGNGILPGQWASEDPHVSEGAQTVGDLTSRGAEIFAVLGSNGVHIRSSAGDWSHFKPDGATNLSVGTVTKVRWLKDRLMVVGTGGREIFEVIADSTPIAIKTLPEGWTFQGVFEAGAFLYAPAVNAAAGLSRVHIIGLNSTASALEDKGSVPIPRGELIYAGIGDPGGIFLGGGRRTEDGGYDPIFYQAFQGDNGFLQLAKIAQGEGAGSLDCAVRAFETLGDAIVFSWSTGSGAPTGARTGLGWYHLGRQAFSFHLRKTAPTGALVTDIIFYNGVILFVVNGDGLYFEDTSMLVSEAYLISSMGDFGSAGLKSWDQAEVSHKELPSGAKVTVQYTTKHVDEGVFTTALTSSTAGTLGASSRFSDVKSSLFAVKLVSTRAGALSAPEIQTFSIRSNPTRPAPEYVLSRFIRVIGKDRKDPYAPEVFVDPVTRRIALQQLLDSWVTVYEPGITWVAFVKDVADTEPAEPFLSATSGERLKEAYIVRLDMVATGVAA